MKTLKNIATSYQELALYRMSKQSAYLSSKGITHNPDWEAKKDEVYITTKFNYLHLESLRLNKTPIFITLTLPSEYHRFKKMGSRHVPNPLYSGVSIDKSYKKLLEIWRDVYNSFVSKENGVSVKHKVKYSRVVEPHKDFTPHLHAICYVDADKEEQFKKHFDNVVKKYSLEQVDYENLSLDKEGKKEDKPKEKSYSISYLLKYVAKTITGKNMVIKGWCKAHKIVAVRTSNMPFNRFEFDLFQSNVPYNPKYKNYYYQMQQELLVNRQYVTVKSELLKQFRDRKGEFIKHVFDKFSHKQIGNLENPKYIINNCYTNVTTTLTTEVEFYENDEITGFQTHQVYDDMFNLPLCDDEGIPIYELEIDNYNFENWFLYHAYNKKYSRVQLELSFSTFEQAFEPVEPFEFVSDTQPRVYFKGGFVPVDKITFTNS